MAFVLCSECFQNTGLQLEAANLGIKSPGGCVACGSKTGHKLTRKHLEQLADRFFMKGTVPHGVGGYASILHYSPDRIADEVELDEKTSRDWSLIKQHIGGGGLFFYGPPLWRVGVTSHYEEPNVISDQAIKEIIEKLAIKTIPKGTKTFRIRKNVDPQDVRDTKQYGLPPTDIPRSYGRFDDNDIDVLYTSPSLPVCLHECRVAITDDIFIATFEADIDLKLADLTGDYRQGLVEPFDDLQYFFNGIFLTRDEYIYSIARRIAKSIKESLVVDGFITNSFFTNISQEPVSQNYCFFQDAIKSEKVTLHSLNQLHLETVSYSYVLGPNFSTAV